MYGRISKISIIQLVFVLKFPQSYPTSHFLPSEYSFFFKTYFINHAKSHRLRTNINLRIQYKKTASEPGQFAASKTWETLYPAPPAVPWHKTIWFKTRIPKHAFLSWVAILNRLPTKDRLQQWGMNVSYIYLATLSDCL